jgi:hypothetical protein
MHSPSNTRLTQKGWLRLINKLQDQALR